MTSNQFAPLDYLTGDWVSRSMLPDGTQLLREISYEWIYEKKFLVGKSKRTHGDNLTFSRLGKLELRVPQTRDSQFYPSALERGERSERALKLAVAEMYVQGVSTRKVAKITAELCGLDVTSIIPLIPKLIRE